MARTRIWSDILIRRESLHLTLRATRIRLASNAPNLKQWQHNNGVLISAAIVKSRRRHRALTMYLSTTALTDYDGDKANHKGTKLVQ
jgi:hypothetical protein